MKLFARFLFAVCVFASPLVRAVDLYCWIVADDNGASPFTEESIGGLIDEVNRLYRQVALTYRIRSLSQTNDSTLAIVRQNDTRQRKLIRAIGRGTGGLELYFVNDLRGRATALHAKTGIIVGPRANGRTLSHEIGHACGLPDIYDVHRESGLSVSGFPMRTRMPNDWGHYRRGVTQRDIIKRLLMYGYTNETKADLTYGDVYGLHYTSSWDPVRRVWEKSWHLNNAPVGFVLHGIRNPSSE